MLLGNATLTRVSKDAQDDYGSPALDATSVVWTGAAPVRVVDQEASLAQAGLGDRVHETLIWMPARMQANDGSYLNVDIGYYLSVVQDGASLDYEIVGISDKGLRLIGSPSDVRLSCARRGA